MANTIVLKDMLMKETNKLLDKELTMVQFCNRAYTGELKKQGDTVTVQTFPRITITTGGTAGNDITSQNFIITGEDLVINQVAQANAEIKDVEELRSNLDLQSEVAAQLAYQLGVVYETFVMYKALASTNIVPSVALTKSNVFATIEALAVKLSEADVPSTDRVLFVTPSWASLIRQAPEWDGFREGSDIRIKGYIGNWAGFRIFESTVLPAKNMYCMQKNAINFVEQMNKMDIRNPYNAFRSNMILEALYGGTVFTENAKKIARCTYT